MAPLAIARGFLGEYAKLDKTVQLAVDAAISTFARHPGAGPAFARPGRTPATPGSACSRSTALVGAVLAPPAKTDGDTYCLVTVLPQDQAVAYATSHRFSVNQRPRRAGGTQRGGHRSNLQPADPPAEAADDTREALRRRQRRRPDPPWDRPESCRWYGSWPRGRPGGAPGNLAPDAQYTALHALAGGMTVDEALAEVVRLVPGGPPPASSTPTTWSLPWSAPPARSRWCPGPGTPAHPGPPVRGLAHLPAPEPAQDRLPARYSGPAQVTGGPGTGKTVTVLHRAAFLAARACAARAGRPRGGRRYWSTTFNGNLADALHAQLDLLIRDAGCASQIEVLNVDRLAYRIVKEARGTPVIADERAAPPPLGRGRRQRRARPSPRRS